MNGLPRTRPTVGLLALVACLLGTANRPAQAQEPDPTFTPAHVSYVDGRVLVDHEDGTEEADVSMPVVAGDRLRTEDGRAEILLPDGSAVQVDDASTIDLLSDDRLRLLEGRIALVASRARTGELQVDTPEGTVSIGAAGEYRVRLFDADGRPTLELSVVRGQADLASDQDRVTVTTGERSWARLGEAPAYPVRFNAASLDAFERWALDRATDRRGGATSAQYVPPALRPYAGVFDTYGSWDYEPDYGHVWYPRVDVAWRPYYTGRWRHYRRFGWTWVGGGAWGWPTHHYGRWGLSRAGAWFWIPGRQWGPAWVSWATANDYVSWCPIGFDDRPVVGWRFTHGGRPGRGRDPWHAWTVVPRQHFGGYRVVSGVAVDGRRLGGTRGLAPSFVPQDRAPGPPSRVASARADRGARGLGTAVPRGTVQTDNDAPRLKPERDGSRASRRFGAGSPADTPASSSVPRRLEPSDGRPSLGSIAPRRDPRARPDVERTPEDLARGSGVAVPRSARPATRLPGDIGARQAPASAREPAPVGSVERPQPNAGWRPDQVPVHRGRIAPPPDAPQTGSDDSPAISRWERPMPRSTGRVPRDGAAVGRVPREDPQVVAPRDDPPSSAPRARSDGAAGPRPGASMPEPRQAPSRGVAPPPSQAPPSAPPPSAAPRQAPSGSRGGSAVPRGGPPPSRHR